MSTLPCPECYGGHFKPCQICGDSGSVETQIMDHEKPRTLPTADEIQLANQAGDDLIWYIDAHFPAMWEGVPKSARTSVKSTVYLSTVSALLCAANGDKKP